MPTYAYFNVGGVIGDDYSFPRSRVVMHMAFEPCQKRYKTIKPNLSSVITLILLNGSLFSHDLTPWPMLVAHNNDKIYTSMVPLA
ncbi:hypothetical protein [Salinivibrio socompensis]|uniref:hypothetical protein n=1 Tax=Salinivibrio socompensis TaxID=1510206 RepID=UPI000FE13F0F|nr:hypothetical protein [Salinivibrio socompensis]